MKILDDKILDEKSDVAHPFFWQILGPSFVLCTFALDPSNPLLLCVGLLGLGLSSQFKKNGFACSFAMLIAIMIGETVFSGAFPSLWTLGLEGSYSIAFFITALSSERHGSLIQSLSSQLEAKNSSIGHLEEEFSKSHEELMQQQVQDREKLDALQARIEESLSEQSSLVVLNEVLRQTTKKNSQDKQDSQEEVFGLQNRLVGVIQENGELQSELLLLKDQNALVLENRKLIDEINEIRLAKEQTQIINETIARLLVKEKTQGQDFCEQLSSLAQEKQKIEDSFVSLQKNSSQASDERDHYKTELHVLEEKLKQAEIELGNRKEVVPVELEDRVKELTQIEAMYKQLKAQFEEKNKTLHEVRKQLFHADNELMSVKIDLEKQELIQGEIPQEIVEECFRFEQEISSLQRENEELQNLVSTLSLVELPKRKKKLKVNPDQETLF